MPKLLKGARPIVDHEILEHYQRYDHKCLILSDYILSWSNWLQRSTNKKIIGIDGFKHAHFVQGTSQAFDHFALRHRNQEMLVLPGEFQYHRCIARNKCSSVVDIDNIKKHHAMVISLPFSDTGSQHRDFKKILERCNVAEVDVCLDLAYWGISKNIVFDLDDFPCVKEFTVSLSKPFYMLETHRVGIRFSREYLDDGICMQNEVGSINLYSMGLGKYFLDQFSPDWAWNKYGKVYHDVCQQLDLQPTDTVIFAMGNEHCHVDFNRGVPGQYRVCLSEYLAEYE